MCRAGVNVTCQGFPMKAKLMIVDIEHQTIHRAALPVFINM